MSHYSLPFTNYPPFEVHFQTQSGSIRATSHFYGFLTLKAARKFLRSEGYSIKQATITTRTEPEPYPATTIISIVTEVI